MRRNARTSTSADQDSRGTRMKKARLTLTQLLVAFAAIIGVTVGTGFSSAAEGDHELPQDVLGTVTAFHEALCAGNSAAVEQLLAPDLIVMESGNIERSRAEYAEHHLPADLKFMRAMKYTLQHQFGEAGADFAWVASEATLTGEYEDKPVNLVSMESLTLRKEQAGWRIVHIHWSSRSQSEKR